MARGKASHVITQNIDGLHQASGVPDDQVIELHGNTRHARCLDCGAGSRSPTSAPILRPMARRPIAPRAAGSIKTATISFGQPMPEAEMARAQAATLACDLMLVLGSSLAVYPAAGFPLLAKRQGARLVILNREETPQDDIADLAIDGPKLALQCGRLLTLYKRVAPPYIIARLPESPQSGE